MKKICLNLLLLTIFSINSVAQDIPARELLDNLPTCNTFTCANDLLSSRGFIYRPKSSDNKHYKYESENPLRVSGTSYLANVSVHIMDMKGESTRVCRILSENKDYADDLLSNFKKLGFAPEKEQLKDDRVRVYYRSKNFPGYDLEYEVIAKTRDGNEYNSYEVYLRYRT